MLTVVGAHAGILRGLPSLFGVMAGMGLMMFLDCSSYRNDFCLRSNGRTKEER